MKRSSTFSVERRALVATTHAREHAVAFLVEVVRRRGIDHERPARRSARERTRRHDHPRDGFQRKVYAGGRGERSRPRTGGVHHRGRGDRPLDGADRGDGVAVRLDRDRLHAQAQIGAGTPGERRVALREPRGIRDPVVRAERRADDVVDRDPGRDRRRPRSGASNCASTPSDRWSSAPARNSAQSCSSPHEEEVPVLHDVQRQTVLLR